MRRRDGAGLGALQRFGDESFGLEWEYNGRGFHQSTVELRRGMGSGRPVRHHYAQTRIFDSVPSTFSCAWRMQGLFSKLTLKASEPTRAVAMIW